LRWLTKRHAASRYVTINLSPLLLDYLFEKYFRGVVMVVCPAYVPVRTFVNSLLFSTPAQEVNELLRPYEALHLFMHAWLVLAVDSPAVVYGWRLQAERQMRDSGRGGMTDEQVLSVLLQCSCCGFCFFLLLHAERL